MKQLKQKIVALSHSLSHRTLLIPKDIANPFADYYQSLYDLHSDKATPQPSPELINSFLSKVKLPNRTDDQLKSTSQPFATQEFCLIIKKLPNHKSPGDDGFSNKYYKCLPNETAPHLQSVFNLASSSGTFPSEMLRAVIVTIPKPNKGPTSPANCRPISILNMDVNIFAKLLALGLQQILTHLIHPDQVGFVPGHQAPDGTRHVINLTSQAGSS